MSVHLKAAGWSGIHLSKVQVSKYMYTNDHAGLMLHV